MLSRVAWEESGEAWIGEMQRVLVFVLCGLGGRGSSRRKRAAFYGLDD